MPQESHCLRIPKDKGQTVINLLRKKDLLVKDLKIQKENKETLCIPIIRKINLQELESIKTKLRTKQIEQIQKAFERKAKHTLTLEETLRESLPSELLNYIPRALDVIGDIAIIEIPGELKSYKKLIGQTILQTHKNIKTVMEETGAVSGTYRIRNLRHLAGKKNTTTIHKEFGCSYQVDVSNAYFSPRLSTEHRRVASVAKDGEKIVDLFAGVGPFAILIAKEKNVTVYAVDINPVAVELLKQNIIINGVDSKVVPILGDAREIVKTEIKGVADRVIMNLPESANEFIDVACKAVKKEGGIIHFYAFVRLPNTIEDLKHRFKESVKKEGRNTVRFSHARKVRATAPYEWQMVLDAEII